MDRLLTDRWAEIDTLFAQALDRPADERTAFLRARCGDDLPLYDAVCALLDADTNAERALGESATDFAAHLFDAASADDKLDLVPGTRVGAYRIEGELGRGGMGTVYRAARADGTFDKAVALKLVKRGMDTDEVLRRFRYERHVLAGLDHPNVARLLDAGAADDGRPYLVMELVEGEPLVSYAETHGLDLEQRLTLFEQVCAAVAYAHRHLVVHRDLKPSNILVAEDEHAAPHVKLLDFGVARLLEDEPDNAPRTRAEQRILTPEYAAPEQFDGGMVTTATDVYALGVVLYELLTGQRPTSPTRRPSEAAPEQSRALRGDLDTLTLKALHPDPARRYPSAEALLDDLQRRRDGLPLQARPDRIGYRMQKFVGRHRWGVGVAALALFALAGFLGVLAAEQRETARERDAAQATAAFLEEVFTASDPYAAEPVRLDTLRARDLLARGADRIQSELTSQPALQARLLTTIGSVYTQLGLFDEAGPILEQALALRQRLLHPESGDVAETQSQFGRVARHLGDFEEAEAHLTTALSTLRRTSGPDHPRTLTTQRHLAGLYEETSRYPEAEALLLDLAERERRRPDTDTLELALTLNTLAVVLRQHERFDEAEAPAREGYALRRAVLGDGHPAVAGSMGALGAILRNQGRLEEAEEAYRASLSIMRDAVGEDHRDTQIRQTHLAELLRDQGKLEESATLYREVLARTRATRGEDFFGVAIITSLLGNVLQDAGQHAEAEALFRDALARMEDVLPPGHVRIARTSEALSQSLSAQRRYAEAEPLLLEAHRLYESADFDTERVAERLVELYEAWGRPEEADRYRNLLPE